MSLWNEPTDEEMIAVAEQSLKMQIKDEHLKDLEMEVAEVMGGKGYSEAWTLALIKMMLTKVVVLRDLKAKVGR